MNTLGVQAGSGSDLTAAPPFPGHAGNTWDGRSSDSTDSFDLDRPLGAWRSAALHSRRFRRNRLLSLLALITATRRIERIHGVATVLARDAVATLACLCLYFLLATVGVAGTVLTAIDGWPVIWGLLPVVVAAVVVAGVAAGQRVEAWWRWRRYGNVLVVANVAVDEDGRGHGDALVGDLVRLADAVGRTLVLRVDSSNGRAVRLYRRHGFESIDGHHVTRMRMLRPAATDGSALPLDGLPSWLVPIPVRRRAVVVGTAAGVGLTAVYWGSPAAWLFMPFGLMGWLAADCDLRWLRIPNRLVAAGGVLHVAVVVVVGSLFDTAMLGAALAGAAIASAPLFLQHVATRGATPGLGDVKLAGVLGLVAGAVHPAAAIIGVLASLLLGAVLGLLWQRRWRRGRAFPLGPALAAGTAFSLAVWPLLEAGSSS